MSYIRNLPILQFCIGVILGAVCPCIAVFVVGIVSIIVCFLLKRFRVWLGFGLGLVVVFVRVLFIPDGLPDNHISELNDDNVDVKVIVTSDINMKSDKCSLVVDAIGLCIGIGDKGVDCEEWQVVNGGIQTWIARFPRVKVGDVLIISGKLEEPKDFENTDKFSYESYLAGKGIYSVMYRPQVEYTDDREIFLVYGLLLDFRDVLLDKINRLLPEPHASLLAGILLGARRNMPEDFALALQRTGTTHVIAASGYNVTLVINAVVAALSFMHRKSRIVLSMVFVWIFVLMSGASLPVVRAAVMGCFALMALLSGRTSVIHVALPLSGAVMVLVDPSVISSISFQLSFVSTAGLIYLVPVLQKMFPWIPESLQDSTLVTFSAVIATFPITAFNFGQFSVVTPLANFLVLPVIELTMVLGMVVVVLPGFFGVFTRLIASIAWVPLEYFVKVVSWISSFSFASIDIPDVPGWSVLVFYGLLFFIILLKYPSDQSTYLIKDLDV